MKPLKRPLDVVDAAALALRREPDLRFLVVGEGACREQMEKACRAHNVDARFHFANWLPYELMADCYRLADIVVMPSEREGMALVYLEAQASGCVLLASDIPAARDAIRDGETGILFPLADAEALADCLVNVVGDRSSATRIGEQARQWIVGNRTLERCVAGYAAAIDSMLR